MAPLLNTTELFAAVASKPKPLMITVEAPATRVVVLLVIEGTTVATLIGAPFATVFDVTTAVRSPALVGFVENVTSIEVALAVVTVPTAPLLKVTLLLEAVKSKPDPLIVIVLKPAFWLLLLLVTTGRAVAT